MGGGDRFVRSSDRIQLSNAGRGRCVWSVLDDLKDVSAIHHAFLKSALTKSRILFVFPLPKDWTE